MPALCKPSLHYPRKPGAAFALLFAWAFLAAGAGYCPAAEMPQVRHSLSVTLDPVTGTLTGTDRIRFAAAWDPPVLRLAPGAEITRLERGDKPAGFSFKDGRVALEGPGVKPGEEILVSYRAVFQDPYPERPLSSENPGYGVTATIGPAGAFLLEGAGWRPSLSGVRESVDLSVDMPPGWLAVTAGRLLEAGNREGRGRCRWLVEEPVDGLSLSAGPYVLQSLGSDPVIQTFFLADNTGHSPTYLEAAAAHIRRYQGLLGPYPFGKFAVVENFFQTGYGFPSYTLLGGRVLQLPFIPQTSLRHEVAHSWWGNGVWVDYKRGNWCEGLTTYLSDYLREEEKGPAEAREYRRQILRDYAALAARHGDLPLREFTSRSAPAERAVGYGKAAMVFHMARLRVGEEAFWKGLRRAYREFLFREASWEDILGALAREGHWPSGEMERFIKEWIDRAGAPGLALEDVRARREGVKWMVEGRLAQSGPAYFLDVPLELTGTDGKTRQMIHLEGPSAAFSLESPGRPQSLAADPDSGLFRLLAPGETPLAVNTLKAAPLLTGILSRGESPELLGLFLASLGHPGAEIVREDDLGRERPRGALLILGLPQTPAGRALVPGPEPEALPGREAAGVLFTLRGDARDPDRAMGLVEFREAAPQAREEALRKITHYGKFSYLGFSGGRNVLKGSWPPAASPLVHRFGDEP